VVNCILRLAHESAAQCGEIITKTMMNARADVEICWNIWN